MGKPKFHINEVVRIDTEGLYWVSRFHHYYDCVGECVIIGYNPLLRRPYEVRMLMINGHTNSVTYGNVAAKNIHRFNTDRYDIGI